MWLVFETKEKKEKLQPKVINIFSLCVCCCWSVWLLWPHEPSRALSLCSWDFPGKKHWVVILQRIFHPGRESQFLWNVHRQLILALLQVKSFSFLPCVLTFFFLKIQSHYTTLNMQHRKKSHLCPNTRPDGEAKKQGPSRVRKQKQGQGDGRWSHMVAGGRLYKT